MMAQKTSAFFSWATVILLFVTLVPLTANAGAVVIFFSGLCVGGSRQVTCSAGRNAYNAIKPLLPAGADIYSPTLYNGKFTNNGEQQAVLQAIKSNKAVLVAFSAGHQALWQTISGLSGDDLKRVHSIVNLEANYGGWYSSVSRVRRHNPATEVHSFTSGSCGTNHDNMPGNSCIAGKIATLAKAAHDGTPSSIPQGPPPAAQTPPASTYNGSPPGSPTGAPTGSAYTQPSQPYTGYTPVSTGYSSPLGQPYQGMTAMQPLQSGSYKSLLASSSPTTSSIPKASSSVSFVSLTTGQSSTIVSHTASSSTKTASPDQPEATIQSPKSNTTFETPSDKASSSPESPGLPFDLVAALASIIAQIQALLAALFSEPALLR